MDAIQIVLSWSASDLGNFLGRKWNLKKNQNFLSIFFKKKNRPKKSVFRPFLENVDHKIASKLVYFVAKGACRKFVRSVKNGFLKIVQRRWSKQRTLIYILRDIENEKLRVLLFLLRIRIFEVINWDTIQIVQLEDNISLFLQI